MKIGLVIEHIDPRRGGAEQWTCQMALRLLARGHEVHLVTKDHDVCEDLYLAKHPPVTHNIAAVSSRLGLRPPRNTYCARSRST